MERLPSLFISHGAPTYALEPGLAGAQLNQLGSVLPRPAAVLVVSPHWMTRQPEATSSPRPRTIHDFGGFDPALYDMSYPAAGHPELAARAIELIRAAGWQSPALNAGRGLDHGAWVPLMHLYPQHDVPVFQVSLPHSLDSRSAFEYGRALAPLGEEGVLVVGSGSLTHNLFEFREQHAGEAEYAQVFTTWIREAVQAGDATRVIQALEQAPHAARAHPTAEHFLPLLVALGAARSVLPATVLSGGIVHGVLSMESYVFGQAVPLETQRQQAAEHA
ncbi:MAG TPA: class III extradiol ring-cleavage dioxygenase [Ramlibacter sp.]|nr:class III extradiol ring-cleavage dioxygenase [Ramlibacter sp.]